MTGKIFINYRRGDDAGHTGRLFDRLQDVFPPEQLFLDVDNIAPGLDFVRVLNERVADCDIVLAVIGKGWLDSRDAAGNRRLEDPDDFVRIEITSALNQGKRVIPVLVGEAQMPRPEDLPEALQPLTRRNWDWMPAPYLRLEIRFSSPRHLRGVTSTVQLDLNLTLHPERFT